MQITVSELIVQFMERLGIDHIFGMPGAHILPVYDCLYRSHIKAVLAKHEQGAAFMASGYVKASGNISACITTAGPGATNLITGIANAYADKQPILIITGETSTHIFGKGGLQESSGEGGSIDQCALFNSITKYQKLIERTDYLANILNRTAKILLSDSPGPVLLSFPYNVQKELVDDSILEQIKTRKTTYQLHNKVPVINDLLKLIQGASAPVIIAGYGCIISGAQNQVTHLSERMNIPVSSSLKAKGVINEHAELSLGSLGVTSYGKAYNYILEKSDLIIFLGTSFNERTSYVWNNKLLKNKKIAQIDNHIEQLEKVFKADVAILGDLNELLSSLLKQLDLLEIEAKQIPDTSHKLTSQQDKQHSHDSISTRKIADLRSSFSLVNTFFTTLESYFPKNLILFDDNIIFAQNFFNVSAENSYYPNSGISSLGHAIPAAIGATFFETKSFETKRLEKKSVFAVIGDGGFQMCCMEIMTAVNYQLPLTIILFNNSSMGLIRKNQSQQYDKRFINCDFVNPDYKLLAKSFGIEYFKIQAEQDLNNFFPQLDYQKSINLIEIMIDKDTFPGYSSNR